MCKEYEIQYWLDCGTLIGAVRHAGIIPWDEDLDVCMTIANRNKLQQLLDTDVPKNKYSIIQSKNNNKWIGIRNDSAGDSGLDIFGMYLIAKPKLFYFYVFADLLRTRKRPHKTTIITIIKRPFLKRVRKYGKILFNHLIGKINVNEANPDFAWHSDPENFSYPILKPQTIFPLTTLKFENLMLPVPNDYDVYLTKMYGDYMKPLPKNKRRLHTGTAKKYYVPD